MTRSQSDFKIIKDLINAASHGVTDVQSLQDCATPFLTQLVSKNCKTQTASALTDMTRRLVETRRSLKSSFRFVTILVLLGCLGVIWNGFLKIFSDLFSLKLLDIIVKVYQILFALVVFAIEVSRFSSIFRIKKFIHFWMPILEFTVGRGLLQLLSAGLAIGEGIFTSGGFFSLILAIIGFFNLLYGVAYVVQFNLISKKIQRNLLVHDRNSPEAFGSIQKKFQAMDINGDGRLTKEEFASGCHEINIMLSDFELDTIFRMFDGDKKGFIEIDRLEAWWYMNLSKTV